MEPVQAFAILSLGAFLTVLVTAVFYILTVRPRLLEPSTLSAVGMLDEKLHAELVEQRVVVGQLNAALAQHTEQLAAAAARMPGEPLSDLHSVLDSQTDAVDSITRLLNAHTGQLSGLDNRLSQQDAKLDHLAARMDTLAGPGVDQQLTTMIQVQADKLVDISTRLDEWVATSARGDEKLSEHARILADLDRELAAQATMVQQLDSRVVEHTTMLVTAATERREQAGLLERVARQVSDLFVLLNQLIKAPPRAGQDRLTDIKGIGPVYAGRLYESGIQTFRQLAAMTPDELFTLISEPAWRMRNIDPQSWIEQAKHLASQREKVENIA